MGQPDLSIRKLFDLYLEKLVAWLLPGRRVENIRRESGELKVVERKADHVAVATVDAVETTLHLEFQIKDEPFLPERLLEYHAFLRRRDAPRPVLTILVYLMPRPPAAPLRAAIEPTSGDPQVSFRYEVFCPWEHPISLAQVEAHPELAALAVLTPGIGEAELPRVREAIERAPLPAEARADLLVLTFFIAGRRFAADLLQLLLESKDMEDSTTYQLVLKKGEELGLARGEELGLAKGEELGLARGREASQRTAILELVEIKLGELPSGLATRLERLGYDALHALYKDLLRAPDSAALASLLRR